MTSRLAACRLVTGLMVCLSFASAAEVLPSESQLFFRLLAPATSSITMLRPSGEVVWSNGMVGSTGRFQRTSALTDPNAWADYVQCVATGTTMSLSLFDTDAPEGMSFVPGGINSGTDIDFGAYVLEVDSFYMDRAHVSKALWEGVRSWGATNGYVDLPNVQTNGSALRPVDFVSWYDAVKWCNARSEREDRPVVYRVDGNVYRTGQVDTVSCDFAVSGYRLPTAQEWEYAARGGLRGKRYPWGNEIDETKANYNYFVDGTTVAGAYPVNGYDLYDMAGNLWQWTWDWHPLHVGARRILCGGSWTDHDYKCRCGHTDHDRPVFRHYAIGFRTVIPAR